MTDPLQPANATYRKPTDMNFLHRQRPRAFPGTGIALGFAAFAALFVALGADSAAAQVQDCFFIFCQERPGPYARPGYPPPPEPQLQREPQWQRGPGWQGPEPYRQDPYRPDSYRPRDPSWQSDSQDMPYSRLYAPDENEPFPVPGIRLSDIDPAYLRKSVYYPTDEPPGTIVVDPQRHFLYFIEGGGRAIRYGVGVGRAGFGWSGVATVHNKQEWPDWYPPKEMIQRQPEIRAKMSELQSGIGMHGGPGNPLGARALYLWQGNKDTLYRIHGTVEPWTIGKSVSSGCIRMINQDVIDLYERAPVGAKVVVLSSRTALQ
jgi:lipoprotein-anchoring transpeptidase ErfK/SrfK